MNKQFIWFAGNTNELFGKIVKDLRAPDPFELDWRSSRYSVRHDENWGLIITMPDETNPESAQEKLGQFFDHVVQPLTDRTAAVSSGLSFSRTKSDGST